MCWDRRHRHIACTDLPSGHSSWESSNSSPCGPRGVCLVCLASVTLPINWVYELPQFKLIPGQLAATIIWDNLCGFLAHWAVLVICGRPHHSRIPLLSFRTKSLHTWSCLTVSILSGLSAADPASPLVRRVRSVGGSVVTGRVPLFRSGNR